MNVPSKIKYLYTRPASFVVLNVLKVARTVIFGGLASSDIAEEVIRRAKEVGTMCSVIYPLPKQELQHQG